MEVKQLIIEEFHSDEVEKIIDLLLDNLAIITVIVGADEYLYQSDVDLCRRIVALNLENIKDLEYINVGEGSYLAYKLKVREDTCLYYGISQLRTIPTYVRNILIQKWESSLQFDTPVKIELLGCTVETTNSQIVKYVQNAIYRKHIIDKNRYSEFTKSGSYMGSKKRLSGFVLESSIPFINSNTTIVDLMCGSGAISNTFAMVGDVISSDAQKSCQLLAYVQGNGYTKEHATKVILELSNKYRENLFELQNRYATQLQWEDALFHMDTADVDNLYEEYINFCKSTQLYSNFCTEDDIISNVIERKKDHFEFPYCLFTLYYANIFFGLSQCMELDSIRYAIDGLGNDTDKMWALGILIIVTSVVSTTYGGHFAQPIQVTKNNLINVLRERQRSVWLEFNARFLAIAEASESIIGKIRTISGPWENAINQVKKLFDTDNLLIYLDAPYKREEYSRYYHVLETMALYDYPSSEGKGHMRSKKMGERFKTVFATRTNLRIEDEFVKIISEILNSQYVCLWSYSNNGAVSIVNVVNRILEIHNCDIFIYGTRYKHSMQGPKTKRKKSNSSKLQVIEYCIAFKLKGV